MDGQFSNIDFLFLGERRRTEIRRSYPSDRIDVITAVLRDCLPKKKPEGGLLKNRCNYRVSKGQSIGSQSYSLLAGTPRAGEGWWASKQNFSLGDVPRRAGEENDGP